MHGLRAHREAWWESSAGARRRPRWKLAGSPRADCPRRRPQELQSTFLRSEASNAVGSTSNATPSRPSAAHPDRGSLQEGTVFPGLGSPGTGNVPSQGASASTVASNTTTTVAAAASGRATTPPGTVFPASTMANGGVPSEAVTPTQPSNLDKQSAGTSSNVVSADPTIVPAPALNADAIPASNRSLPRALGEVTAVVPTVQPKTETVAATNQNVTRSLLLLQNKQSRMNRCRRP